VELKLETRATEENLKGFDQVVLATGVNPRNITIPGSDHAKVVSYIDVLQNRVTIGNNVAIIGAGGIGFDVAEYLSHKAEPDLDAQKNIQRYLREWGVDSTFMARGGLEHQEPPPSESARNITMLQRSGGKLGARLGKTTGWIHRASMKKKNIAMRADVEYLKIDDEGLHVRSQSDNSVEVIAVDHVIVCAGQEPNRALYDKLRANGLAVTLIGGADVAAELDAKRAIGQGSREAALI
jgi:2,4-dienoyl-CoA reductase (NADPH2)